MPEDVISSWTDRQILNEKKYLLITVSDNGQSIPSDEKEWIFRPLTTTSPDGSGLGLSIIKETLEAMNGCIFETGTNGTKFEIYIPDSHGGEK